MEAPFDSIKAVLMYLWEDEENDFERWRHEVPDDIPSESHIFWHLSRVSKWLSEETAHEPIGPDRGHGHCDYCGMANVKCPQCGVLTCNAACPRCHTNLESLRSGA